MHPCVAQLLCGFSNATQAAIRSLLSGYIAQLEAAKLALQAQLARLALSVAPQIALEAVARQAIEAVLKGANVIPLDLIGTCFEIGKLNDSLRRNLDIVLADAKIIQDDLNRLLSFQDELNVAIAELDTIIFTFSEFLDTFNLCASLNLNN